MPKPLVRMDVYKKLIQVAKDRKTITYKDLMDEFVIPRGNPHNPARGIGPIVGYISEFESHNKRPLISALVVLKKSKNLKCPDGHPSGGFFGIHSKRIPTNLTRDESSFTDPKLTEDELNFVKREQKKVWHYWSEHNG